MGGVSTGASGAVKAAKDRIRLMGGGAKGIFQNPATGLDAGRIGRGAIWHNSERHQMVSLGRHVARPTPAPLPLRLN